MWFYKDPFRKNDNQANGFTELNPDRILLTLDKLLLRIGERFPDSGLRNVCREFQILAEDCALLAMKLSKPIWIVRLLSVLAGSTLIILVISIFNTILRQSNTEINKLPDLIQTMEAAINEMILLSIAFLFLVGLEIRVKRHFALRALHKLRSIGHVVDMHQLTKDPAYVLSQGRPTRSSPERKLSRTDLIRYLDYCSEMLALNSKVAALFVQNLNDPAVLTAVNQLDELNQGLSSKIWQKIMILDLSASK